MISSPTDSPKNLVFENIWFIIQKFEGVIPSEGDLCHCNEYDIVLYELGIYRPLGRCIPEMVQDRSKVAIDH